MMERHSPSEQQYRLKAAAAQPRRFRMFARRSPVIALALIAAAALTLLLVPQSTAPAAPQEPAVPAPPPQRESPYGATIDRVMGQIVAGRIDEALAAIEFLKQQPDTRSALRDHLVELANTQQHLYGYDIAALQRFSDRLLTVSVLAYYEQQPILFRFELYRPQGRTDQPWLVQALSLHIDVMEELKDTPVDYVARRAAPR
jgi:hypothetical protein